MADPDRNKDTVGRVYATCWNQGDMAAVDGTSLAGVEHDNLLPGWPTGREGFKTLVQFRRKAFSDVREDVVELRADGDQVASLFRLRETHQGDFYGIRAPGEQSTSTAPRFSAGAP